MRTPVPFVLVAMLSACSGPPMPVAASSRTSVAARGLPQHLLPADFGTPQYVPPRHCPPALRDEDRPGVQLTLERWTTRIDWKRTSEGSIYATTTTTTTRVPEGEYRVNPEAAYGLQPGQRLRVDCDRDAAVTVVEPAT